MRHKYLMQIMFILYSLYHSKTKQWGGPPEQKILPCAKAIITCLDVLCEVLFFSEVTHSRVWFCWNLQICGAIGTYKGFPGGLSKESTCNSGATGDVGLIPGSGRSPGGGHGNPLQYSCLETPMDRGAWRAAVHTVRSQSWTQLWWLSSQALRDF